MKRTKVKIEKETKKAYLIADESGAKGWIQKRWLAADCTVAVKTFERAVKNFKERAASYAEAREWLNSYHTIKSVKRETEKAVAVEANFDAYNLERDFSRLIWIPKSLLKNMAVPGWFIAKKVREVAENLTEQIHTGVFCDYIAVENCERLL